MIDITFKFFFIVKIALKDYTPETATDDAREDVPGAARAPGPGRQANSQPLKLVWHFQVKFNARTGASNAAQCSFAQLASEHLERRG